MESEWRFTIWNQGMWGLGWQLCARIFQPPFLSFIVKESPTTFGFWRFNGPTPTSPLQRTSGPFAIPAGARFPYGIPVFPD